MPNNEEKLYKNYDWMYHHYWMLEESTYVMARLAGCSSSTIWYWLHKLGIPTRVIRNHLDMSSELQEFIEGELLGDGSIVMNGQRSALYQHDSKYEEYLIWISGEFANQGLEQTGKIYKRIFKQNDGIAYHYASKSYPELVSLRERWYPNGKKIIPQDLGLTPIMIRQWYIGDGSLCYPRGGRSYIVLATCAFNKPSTDHLLKELSELGFKARLWPASNIIAISAHSTKDFLNYVGLCPDAIEDIYGYKWNYQDNRKSRK